MKLRIALAVCLALVAIPVVAQQGTVYSNGAINGTTDAWTINFGFVVSDSFTTGGGIVNGLAFGAWLFPGDVLQVLGSVGAQVGALGEVLAQQPVRVLVAAALPG